MSFPVGRTTLKLAATTTTANKWRFQPRRTFSRSAYTSYQCSCAAHNKDNSNDGKSSDDNSNLTSKECMGKEEKNSIWSTPDDFYRIFENNRKWVKENLDRDPLYFKKLAQGQQPKYLFIGCSDSRVNANEILGLSAGELFVHRNIANLCVNSDLNFLSVLQYSVEILKVRDIIVCGHYGCGGVEAAMNETDLGLLEHWLRNIRDVHRQHYEELREIDNIVDRRRRMVELNVIEQCINLFKNSIIQRAQAEHGFPRIHGFVYDIGEGIMHELDYQNFKDIIRQYRSIYKLDTKL